MKHIQSHDMALIGNTTKQFKTGGEIPNKGKKITMSVQWRSDKGEVVSLVYTSQILYYLNYLDLFRIEHCLFGLFSDANF